MTSIYVICPPHPIHGQEVYLEAPEKTALGSRGSAVTLPLRAGPEVSLRFVPEGEAKELLGT
jgi:hypothetical protein